MCPCREINDNVEPLTGSSSSVENLEKIDKHTWVLYYLQTLKQTKEKSNRFELFEKTYDPSNKNKSEEYITIDFSTENLVGSKSSSNDFSTKKSKQFRAEVSEHIYENVANLFGKAASFNTFAEFVTMDRKESLKKVSFYDSSDDSCNFDYDKPSTSKCDEGRFAQNDCVCEQDEIACPSTEGSF